MNGTKPAEMDCSLNTSLQCSDMTTAENKLLYTKKKNTPYTELMFVQMK